MKKVQGKASGGNPKKALGKLGDYTNWTVSQGKQHIQDSLNGATSLGELKTALRIILVAFWTMLCLIRNYILARK